MMEDIFLTVIFSISSILIFISPVSSIYIITATFSKSTKKILVSRKFMIYIFGSATTFMITSVLSLIKMIGLIDFPNIIIVFLFIYGLLFQLLFIIRVWFTFSEYEYLLEYMRP